MNRLLLIGLKIRYFAHRPKYFRPTKKHKNNKCLKGILYNFYLISFVVGSIMKNVFLSRLAPLNNNNDNLRLDRVTQCILSAVHWLCRMCRRVSLVVVWLLIGTRLRLLAVELISEAGPLCPSQYLHGTILKDVGSVRLGE